MNTGPSKEQIESFYKTSRKYFDELARHYYEKDRDFYNKYFAPYYKNPLYTSSKAGIPNLRARLVFMSILILVAGLIFSLTYFFTGLSEREELKAEKELMEQKRNQELIERQLLDSLLNMDSTVRNLSEPLIIKEKNGGAKRIKRKPVNK